MAGFLKLVSVIYLILIWAFVVLVFSQPAMFAGMNVETRLGTRVGLILSAVIMSIPAAALYAFGQIVGDVRQIRDDTRAALRQPYEAHASTASPRSVPRF